jgi:hypothetical protein
MGTSEEQHNFSAALAAAEATTLVPECHVKWDREGMEDGKRGF